MSVSLVDAGHATPEPPGVSGTAGIRTTAQHPCSRGPCVFSLDGAFMGQTRLPELLSGTEAALPIGSGRQVEVFVTDRVGRRDAKVS